MFERCVTRPVGTWSVACKQWIRSVGDHVRNLTTSYFEQNEMSATKPPFTIEVALLYVFSSSNSLVFLSFLHFSDLSHRQEQGGSMPSMQAVAPSPGQSTDGSEKVQTFDKRTYRLKPFVRQRFVSVLWLHHAPMHDLVEV